LISRIFQRSGIWLVIAGLVCIYVLVRCLHLELFVTTDEPFWLGRSANFYRALVQGDLAHTYQMAHPGVLTMWAGTIAYFWAFPDYAQEISRNLDYVYGIGAVLRELHQDPLHILIVARIVKILVQAVFFGISLSLLQRLFTRPVMVISGLLMALDPFVSGMASLLHVDGLFAISSFAAILAMAAAARSRPDEMAPWIIAGVLAACAWMTRATGLVLVTILGGMVLVQVASQIRKKAHPSLRPALESPAFAIMLWLTGAMATSLLLLPALWVDPFGTMQQMWDWSINAATEGHERPTFFLGEIHQGDPGVWFYPVTLLWRLTPVSIAGFLLFLTMGPVAYRRRWLTPEFLKSLAILVAFAVVYAGAMTFGAKKFDRYILPVYPIVSVLAAVGIVLVARWIRYRLPGRDRMILPAIAAIFIVGQAVSLIGALPYRLDYFNPMLGGLDSARHHVQVGWGEGGKEVIAFVVEDADGRDVTVQTSSATPMFSYFATPNIHFDDFGLGTPAGWYETHYFITGIQEWQRDLSPSYHVMQAYDPTFEVTIEDVPFFKVYTPSTLPLPDHLRTQTGCTAILGDTLQLMQIIGRDGTIDLYWLTIDESPGQLEVSVTLTAPASPTIDMPVMTTRWTVPASGYMSRSTISDPRTAPSPPLTEYTMIIQVRNPATGELLPVNPGTSAASSDGFTTHSDCYDAE